MLVSGRLVPYDQRVTPSWRREELIIVCAALKANGWKPYRAQDAEAVRLSRILRAANFVPAEDQDEKFRNPNGVQRKMNDLMSAHPAYPGKATKGGRATREVVAEFVERPEEMDARARELTFDIRAARTALRDVPRVVDINWESDTDLLDIEVEEGDRLMRRHYRRERNQRIRRYKLETTRALDLPIACEVCSFNFGESYGDLGAGYIEVHHILPLHASGPTTTRLTDLALLCANCHRMIHRSRPWLTPAELAGKRRALCPE